MRLQSIEIRGFKSFYHKTRIEFPDGIISIVGPNGSGKSNILDAFRWVLGEQSVKNLRGEKMDDVIFSGTKKHKQANFCEVEITLDNTDRGIDIDFTEISVKRKTYRDGDTKYYINGKTCRLKDVRELFMDSGIGKEGYSIISQGKIDEIVNSSSKERRKLLEEASGISRYRYKKEESEKMIEESKTNLERLEDIFAEIERQVLPLYEQKTKALQYLEVQEKLKRADISLLINDYVKVDAGTQTDLIENERTLAQIADLESKLETMQEKTELLGLQDEKNKEKLQDLKNQEHAIEVSKNNTQNDILRYKEKIDFKREILTKTNNERNLLSLKQESMEEEESRLKLHEDEIEKENQHKRKENEILAIEIDELSKTIRNEEQEIQQWQRQSEIDAFDLNEMKSKIQFIEENQKWISHQKEENKARKDKYNQNLHELYGQDLAEEAQVNTAEEEHKRLQESKQEEQNKQKEVNQEIQNIQQQLAQKNQQLRDNQAKLRMYQRMENEMEGFNRSVKTVLSNPSLQGIIDVVSNIIHTEEKYEKAIEIALGASMQHIITRNNEAAKKAIEYLKQTRSGRATFLPLDTVKPNRLQIKDVLLACDVVQAESKYTDLISSLLGRTIIANNMDQAISMARNYSHKYRIVTLEGELFNPGGSITGGHYLKNNEILSRKRVIQDTESEILRLESAYRKHAEEIDRHRDKEQKLGASLEAITKAVAQNRDKVQQAQSRQIEIKSKIAFIENEIKALESESNQYVHQNKTTNDEILQLKEKYQKEKNLHDDKILNLNDLKQKLEEDIQNRNRKQEQKNEVKLELLSLSNKLENIANDRNRIHKQIKENELKLAEYKAEILQIHEEIRISEKEVEEAYLAMKLCDIEMDETSIEHEEVAKEAKQLEHQLKKILEQGKQLEEKRLQLIEEKYKFDAKIQRISAIKEQIIEKLREEYDLDIEQALAYELVPTSKELVSELRIQLNHIGPINLASIEEYDLISERYETYKVQIDDLKTSIENLEIIIRKLESDMAKDFQKYFTIINENFGQIFKKLFGGGEAQLALVNSADILNTDIEIFAQPPGKKLKSISVLSGGEKALMGIAILFAIQTTKPAPFCILDEIDAALDDSNISRFNAFLMEMANQIQFVTITHRRGTMESSDYIYGVTMQDKGVSNVVSIKFEEAQEYIEQ